MFATCKDYFQAISGKKMEQTLAWLVYLSKTVADITK